jgi:hypothetical protein
MICMPHLDSNISDPAIFGAVNSQFSSFLSLLKLQSLKKFFVAQMVSLRVLCRSNCKLN